MAKQIIKANPSFKKEANLTTPTLNVAEFFSETIQGEGVSTGVPAAFLRLQGCTLDCVWCDSAEVWRKGNPYTIHEILALIEQSGLTEQLRRGTHLVLTGGSPLKQQHTLIDFIKAFIDVHDFKPFIEIENECVLMPLSELSQYIDQWNNSPKLANSEMKERARYKPDAISTAALLPNSWFKFVVSSEQDWQEIQTMYLERNLIRREQIILMPCGQTQAELLQTRELAVNIAIREGVRYSDRLHIILWDQMTGV